MRNTQDLNEPYKSFGFKKMVIKNVVAFIMPMNPISENGFGKN